LGIGQERERQPQALGEFLLRRNIVGGDAQDLGVLGGELRELIAKRRQLGGSASGERLGKERQHHRAPAVVGELDRFSRRGFEREGGRGRAGVGTLGERGRRERGERERDP